MGTVFAAGSVWHTCVWTALGSDFRGRIECGAIPWPAAPPGQLYESLGCLLISLALLSLRQHPALRGALVWIYLIAYGLLRFAIEFFRGDARPMLGILSLNQIFCLGFSRLEQSCCSDGQASWQIHASRNFRNARFIG